MTRYLWDRRTGEFIDVDTLPRPARRGPFVISDTMDATRHPVTGEVLTSKAAFRQRTRDAGCVEIGTEIAAATRPREIGGDLSDVTQDLHRTLSELS